MLCRRVKTVLDKLSNTRCANYSVAALAFEDIPSPRGLPFVGSIFSMLAMGGPEKLYKYLDKRHRELGPIFKDKIGPLDAVFLSDPDEMRAVFAQEGKYPLHINPDPWLIYNQKNNYRRGLFFMDGEEWLHYRRIMNKILLKGDLSWIDNSCEVASDIFLDRLLLQNAENTEFPNLEKELFKLTMDMMVAVLWGANVYRQSHKALEPVVKELSSTAHLVLETTLKLMLLPVKLAAKYNIPRWQRFENSVNTTLSSANEILDYIRENSQGGNGMLHKMEEENIEREDINRIVADLLLGAGDATTFALEWVLYLISKNKEVQHKIREEDDKTYLRNVLRETLRLYPVAPFLNRILPEDATIHGYTLPAGTKMILSIYTSGRDEKYFKDPEQFLPDRWLRDGTYSTVMLQRASLPFATGVRSCVGKKIAETAILTTLSKIVKHFDVELCNERDITMDLQMVSKPSEDLRLKFHKL